MYPQSFLFNLTPRDKFSNEKLPRIANQFSQMSCWLRDANLSSHSIEERLTKRDRMLSIVDVSRLSGDERLTGLENHGSVMSSRKSLELPRLLSASVPREDPCNDEDRKFDHFRQVYSVNAFPTRRKIVSLTLIELDYVTFSFSKDRFLTEEVQISKECLSRSDFQGRREIDCLNSNIVSSVFLRQI